MQTLKEIFFALLLLASRGVFNSSPYNPCNSCKRKIQTGKILRDLKIFEHFATPETPKTHLQALGRGGGFSNDTPLLASQFDCQTTTAGATTVDDTVSVADSTTVPDTTTEFQCRERTERIVGGQGIFDNNDDDFKGVKIW